MHVMLQVEDLSESIRFYSALFGTGPTKREGDYAKWMLEDPRLNFSISDRGEAKGLEHLGLQAETPEELEVLRGRLVEAGGPVSHEGEVVCCYHRSDKSWVTDGQGVSWEVFTTFSEAPTYSEETSCCAEGCCSEEGDGGGSCCETSAKGSSSGDSAAAAKASGTSSGHTASAATACCETSCCSDSAATTTSSTTAVSASTGCCETSCCQEAAA
jgi:hypothetical protein